MTDRQDTSCHKTGVGMGRACGRFPSAPPPPPRRGHSGVVPSGPPRLRGL